MPSGISSTAPDSKAKLIAAKQIVRTVSVPLFSGPSSVVTLMCGRPLPSFTLIPVMWWYHVTEVKVSSEHPTTYLIVTTDFSGNDSLSETICRAAFDFAVDEVGDEIEAVHMVDSDGKEGGCA